MAGRKPAVTLRFLGTADTVTGSRHLIQAGRRRILVDCGLFQGLKVHRLRNRRPFPVRPASIDTVLLTHAHVDHTGYLPRLVRGGFRGRVLGTPATEELCGLMLPDSAKLQEEEARHARRHGWSEHRNPQPLYTRRDARAALGLIRAVPFRRRIDLGDGIWATFLPVGHLLGAAQIGLSIGRLTVHFSGDVGHVPDPLMRPPEPFPGADVRVCESTYGNRLHPDMDPADELAPVLKRTLAREGTVLIPAFAVGRAQGLMLHMARLMRQGEIPQVPVFLDSPMAVDATEIYHRHHDEHHVSLEECRAMFRPAKRVNTPAQSRALDADRRPKIIISASGMLTGGRVMHHLAAYGPDRRNTVLLAGYQAAGTLGAALQPRPGALATFSHPDPPVSTSAIRAKVYDRRLSEADFRAIVGDIVAHRLSDLDLAAFVTACAGDRLDLEETVSLTRAMAAAGRRLDWGRDMVLDKHCVGGLPGNRTTPIVVAIVAAAGGLIPKTSSRAITSPAGTADTMEVMAPVDLDAAAMRRVVEAENGCVVWGGALDLSPADDILIRIERPLDFDSEGQMVASILSKKAAAGSSHVLIDMPAGPAIRRPAAGRVRRRYSTPAGPRRS